MTDTEIEERDAAEELKVEYDTALETDIIEQFELCLRHFKGNMNEAVNIHENKWSVAKQDQHATVYQSTVPNTSTAAFKSIGELPGSVVDVFRAMFTPEYRKHWDSDTVDINVAEDTLVDTESGPLLRHFVWRQHLTGVRGLVTPRDLCMRSFITNTEVPGAILQLAVSIEHEAYPPMSDLIRANTSPGGVLIEPVETENGEPRARLSITVHCELGGSLFPWITNKVTPTSISGLYKRLHDALTSGEFNRPEASFDPLPHRLSQQQQQQD